MKTIPSPERLAARFSRTIKEWLEEETIVEVNRRNRASEYEACCATHDFCDANQAMVESLQAFGLDFRHDLIDLINAAWNLAKQNGFQR